MNALKELTGAQAAAVFVTLLGDGDASKLLAQLEPEELEQVGASMCDLGDIEGGSIVAAIGAFIEQAERDIIPAGDRKAKVRSLLDNAVGPVKAESMMQRIEPEGRPRSLEIARWLVPSVTARLIENEHPQVIAVLLLMLEAENAANVLSLLDPDIQPLIVERIARMGPVSSDAIAMLDTLLQAQIGSKFGTAALAMGGPSEAANLINLASGEASKNILPVLEEINADLAASIEAEMFTFEMLLELEPMAMGRLLRDVDNEVLVDALKGISDDQRAPFFASMSSRAADGVKDEIEMRGRLKREDVERAQKKVVDVAKGLADQGELELGTGDGDFV